MTGKLPHCFKHANNIGVTFTWLDSATINKNTRMSLPNSSAQDAISTDKNNDCVRAGEAVLTLLEKDIKPSDIMNFPVQSH
jgi:dihydroxy-acid dehydratase